MRFLQALRPVSVRNPGSGGRLPPVGIEVQRQGRTIFDLPLSHRFWRVRRARVRQRCCVSRSGDEGVERSPPRLIGMSLPSKTNRRAFLLATAAGGMGCRRGAATGYPGYCFVANEEGRSVAAVDLSKFRMAREIAIDGNPTAILSYARRSAIYVLTPQSGTIHEIDPISFSVRRKARVAPSCLSMRLSADGGSLWILSRESRALVQLTLDKFETAVRIRLPGAPSDFDLWADRPLPGSDGGLDIARVSLRREYRIGPGHRDGCRRRPGQGDRRGRRRAAPHPGHSRRSVCPGPE